MEDNCPTVIIVYLRWWKSEDNKLWRFNNERAMDVFAEDGLKFFGIDKKVKELGPTELVVLESKNLHMDYTFDGRWYIYTLWVSDNK